MKQHFWRMLFAFVTFLASCLPMAASNAKATALAAPEVVTVEGIDARDVLWIAHAQYQLASQDRGEFVAFALILQQMFMQKTDLKTSDAVSQLHTLQNNYHGAQEAPTPQKIVTDNEHLLSIFAHLVETTSSDYPFYRAMVEASRQANKLTLAVPVTNLGASEDYVQGLPDLLQTSMSFNNAQIEVLQKSLDLARENTQFANAFDRIWSIQLDVSIYDDASQLLTNSEFLKRWEAIRPYIDSAGKIQITPAQLDTLVQEAFNQINDVMQMVLEKGSVLQAGTTQAANASMAPLATNLSIEEISALKEKLNLAKPQVDLLAKLVGHYNPELGQSISVVGNAAIQIASAGMNIAMGVMQIAAGGPVGIVMGVSNIVQGVVSLTKVFKKKGSSGPTPEQLILAEIAKLQQQVAQLRDEMHERFDGIDSKLNFLMDTLVEQFQNIEHDIETVQRQLLVLDAQLRRFETKFYDVVGDGFLQDLWKECYQALNYRYSGTALPYDKFANQYAVNFYTWATNLSYNNVYNPQDDYDNATAYRMLSIIPQNESHTPGKVRTLDRNLNYLARLLNNQWPQFAISNNNLPNPIVWSLASRCYQQMSTDWPELAAKLDQKRLEQGQQAFGDLIAVTGKEMREALQKVSFRDGKANYELFEELFANYQREVTTLDDELKKAELDYLEALRKVPEPDLDGEINLWGSVTDTLSSLITVDMRRCDSSGSALKMPSLVGALTSDQLAGSYLHGKINVCVKNVDWVGEYTNTINEYSCGRFNQKRCYDRMRYGSLKVTIHARLNNTDLSIQSKTYQEQGIGYCSADHHCDPPRADPWAEFINNWDQGRNLKSEFEASYGGNLPDVSQQYWSQVSTLLNMRLRDEQKRFYQAIEEAIKSGSLHEPAIRMSGAQALLNAYIVLGFPRAVESDDTLRSLLYGSERLVEFSQLQAAYTSALATLPAENIRTGIFASLNSRSEALHTVLWKYLDLLNLKAYRESHRLLETTLDRHIVSRAIIHTVPVIPPTPTPTPTDTPTDTPTVTPIVVPSVTPIITPTVTPTVTPVPGTAKITIVNQMTPQSANNLRFLGPNGLFKLDDPASDDNDGIGNTQTAIVAAGIYTITEVIPASWYVQEIVCQSNSDTPQISGNTVTIAATSNSETTCVFKNQRRSVIGAQVFNDVNGNGLRAASEPWLEQMSFNLYDAQTNLLATDETTTTGGVRFGGLESGRYTLCEELTEEWQNNRPGTMHPIFGQPCYTIDLQPGRMAVGVFANTSANSLVNSSSQASIPLDWLIADESTGDACYDGCPPESFEPVQWSSWVDENPTGNSSRIFLPLLSR